MIEILHWRKRLLVALLGSAGLSFTVVGEGLALKPVREYPATPRDYGILYQEVAFLTSDSLTLIGWFYPAQDTTGIANDLVGRVVPVPDALRPPARPYSPQDRPGRPTIIICDGDAGNMADLILYAYHLFSRGFNVFTFDWRGFGRSVDWPLDPDQLCAGEFLRDYDAAIEVVKARPEVNSGRIGLLGFSTGAYLSFAMLSTHPEIQAFAGRALLTSFDDLLPIIHRLDPKRKFRAPADYPPERLPIRVAPGVHAAVLLVVGERDERTPPWMSEKIFSLVKGPKDLWIVPGAGHGGPSAPEVTDYPAFFVRVAAFFSRHLEPPRSAK